MILSGQKDDAPDNFHFVLDKNDFVWAEGQGKSTHILMGFIVGLLIFISNDCI